MRLLTRLPRLFLLTVAALAASACGDDAEPGAPGPNPPAAGDADYTRATPAQRRAALEAAREMGLDGLYWQFAFERYDLSMGDCPMVVREGMNRGDPVVATADGCVDRAGRTFRGGYRIS